MSHQYLGINEGKHFDKNTYLVYAAWVEVEAEAWFVAWVEVEVVAEVWFVAWVAEGDLLKIGTQLLIDRVMRDWFVLSDW